MDLDLYLDCDRAVAVMGPTNSSIRSELPKFVQGDTLHLRVHLLQGFSNVMEEYTLVPTTGITLAAAVGVYPAVGEQDPAQYYTSQFTWTPNEDEADPYFSGTLSFNTEEITELLGADDSAPATLHIYRTESGYPNTVFLERITIRSSTIKDGGFAATVEPTPLSVEVGNTLYFQKAGDDELILVDQTTGDKLRLWFADGALQQEIISA